MTMEIFRNVTIYPPEPPVIPRPKPMRVLVLGLSRTGTLSMWAALSKLGIKSYHFMEAGRNGMNGHYQLWIEAIDAKYNGRGRPLKGQDFDLMLWNYDAVADAPCCLFADELMEAYPEAKVVLTVRSRESWLRSMRRTFLEILSWRSWKILSYLDPGHSRPFITLLEMCANVWSRNIPAWKPSAEPILLQSFDDHYAHMRKIVPAERLLEFHPSQGWDPLCKFLDVPSPDEPFPNVNAGTDVTDFFKIWYWIRWLDVVKRGVPWFAAVGLAAGAAWWYRKGWS